ncbi:hypothetical protein BKG71_17005 [Mycobacteroides chelonae]|uniref:Secreted protein n=1 Tax=Mycobacteroides chelonae TaxID=1774 RepID=A0AB73LTA1_MYCCH|nr:hypothetical protein BKG63_22295 [Mycobacteroides chelonae]OHT54949.1 hypothetical protein BKG62_01785 [Mycobacteroides chelonae]OHT58250.1 hypothetical protein BKG64_16110 [Mycobacteroides chelonae]OHT64454.1 hypothetical protein BKG65_07245 [Mycobacteroides chelonae]OHT99306.1 hypothetical protein BKG72_02345 [Mycobacteroides chelonae]
MLRLLTRISLFRALLPSLLGRPLSARVVDRDSVVLVQRWLVDTALVVRLLRGQTRRLELGTPTAFQTASGPRRTGRISGSAG